jgi:signal transduction histidine kinase
MKQDRGRDSNTLASRGRAHQLWRYALPYLLATVATLLAFAVTVWLRRSTPAPLFLIFVLAVALAAWYGGRGPSVVAIMLSVLLVRYAPSNPLGSRWTNNVATVLPFIVFLIVAVMISLTVEALLRARRLAESHAAELELVNEELRHALVSRRLLSAQETERRRIARVLHEDVGQLLTAVRLNLQRLMPEHANDAVISDTIRLVDLTLKEVRVLSGDLMPTYLDDLGLGAAVALVANRQGERADHAIVVEQSLGDERLPEPIETAAFRIVRHALTNIARHARAKNVHIAMRRAPQSVELVIADDGIGFDVPAAKARSQAGESLGLVEMAEIAYMAGALLTLSSTEGKGTTVRAQFPLYSVE